MKKNTTYYLDNETLTFKPVDKNQFLKRKYLIRGSAFMLTISIFLYFVLSFIGYTPEEIILSHQNEKIAQKIINNRDQIENLQNYLSNIEENDDVIYRPFVEIKPLPTDVREAGFGGTDRYRKFAGLQDGDDLIDVFKEADRLSSQLDIQNKSFDEVEGLVNYKDKYYASKPGIRPILKQDLLLISSPFGVRYHPVWKKRKMHHGIDYAANEGTRVFATGDGVVTAAYYASGYGNVIKISHGFGYMSIYAHLRKFNVHKGDTVTRGQLIAYSGNTGVSTGPHLHYEIRKNNRPVNPLFFYVDDLKDEEYLEIVAR